MTDKDYDASYDGSDQHLLGGFVSIQNMANSQAGKENKKLPLMKIRDKNNYDIFRSFVHYFLRYAVPKKTYMSKRTTQTVSEIFTPADEAFCLLCMMNYWDEWELRNSSVDKKINKKNIMTYWTSSSGAQHGEKSQEDYYVCGWSAEGRNRFNKILVYVVNVRKKQQQKSFEQRLMKEYMDEDNNMKSRKRRRNDDDDTTNEGENEVYDMYAIENGDVDGASSNE